MRIDKKSVLLIFPPGWIYTVGGTYISLPLIKGFLRQHNINSKILDLNLEISKHFNLKVSKQDVEEACKSPTLESLNKPYYFAQSKMDIVSAPFGASWDIQFGYNYPNCNFASSEDIRHFSENSTPFDDFLIKSIQHELSRLSPEIIGISVSVPAQLLSTFRIVRLIRTMGYQGKIVLGGNLITRLDEGLYKKWIFDLIDGAILFQGEETLIELINCLSNNLSWENVPNLIWKNNDGIKKNTIQYLKPENFSRPDFSDIDIEGYWGVNYLPMLGSRGCYYGKCTFCAIPYAYGNNGFLGHDDPYHVFDDMEKGFHNFGINRFKFMDEALHPAILTKLSDLILSRNLQFEFEGYARFDNFWKNTSFLKKVSKAGLKKIYLGLELVNSNKRNLLNKSDSSSSLEMLKIFNNEGIKVHLFTLFGYPGTGVDEALNTIEFALENISLIDTLDIFPFYYAKHTKVPFIEKVENPELDWAIEYNYKPLGENVLTQQQTLELCENLENIIWAEKPQWLHPIYRLYSTWSS